jgi:site-specific DNA-methyltransferase (adenine-specific)
MNEPEKQRAPRNRTLTLSEQERAVLSKRLVRPPLPVSVRELTDQVVCGDSVALLPQLPKAFVDLLILDPPYNLNKQFGSESFREMSLAEYESWFEGWFAGLLPLLKPAASLYVCGDWESSAAIQRVLDRHVIVRNRITWERMKWVKP